LVNKNQMKFFKKYYEDTVKRIQELDRNKINSICKLIKNTSKKRGVIYLAGNGGSASTASHMSTDLTKNAKIKSMSFNDVNLITCFSNDYGYKNWLKAAIKYYTKPNDLIILLSVSGESKNLINAANFCKQKKIKLITITGAKKNNLLSQKGNINYWINSKAYNIVEVVQMTILASIVDRIIGKSEYPSNL
tara:strand:+ start:212 stop:784 length:573 start_codon:yes stop_codon:yes gene_type:complete